LLSHVKYGLKTTWFLSYALPELKIPLVILLTIMIKKAINLSLIEEESIEIPEDIQRMTEEAFQLIWRSARHIAQHEIERVTQYYQQKEEDVLRQRQEALEMVAEVNKESALFKSMIETLKRENKTLEADLNQRFGELKSVQEQVVSLQEECHIRDQEIKYLKGETARSQESLENLKKRFQEVSRQAEQDRSSLEEVREESIVNLRTRERLEKNLKTAMVESEQVWKQLRTEQNRAAVAEAIVQELRENIKKVEAEVKELKVEKQELRSSLEVEIKTRTDLDKKLVAVSKRAEADEGHYKALMVKLEQELESTRSEAVSVRNRIIKTEGALERERKAIERLETKLVAAAGGSKLTP
jgi:chromosome segregation ATPase